MREKGVISFTQESRLDGERSRVKYFMHHIIFQSYFARLIVFYVSSTGEIIALMYY